MQLTPANIYQWRGPRADITDDSGRIPAEQKWYAVTGRVQRVIFENDGDLHIIMKNADHRAGRVVVEVPSDAPWCAIRKAVCSWTNVKFPFRTDEQWGFYLIRRPVVTVIGKAFYDIDHSGKNPRRNRRNYDSSLAVWKIHPGKRKGRDHQRFNLLAPDPLVSVDAAPKPVCPSDTRPTTAG